ncbi:polymer-forming cytoskeletal protein [Pseudodesulfovibrio sp.]|nr:polymer-forming cytoskeletal protein [Pseudodesulfovibrio sp.]
MGLFGNKKRENSELNAFLGVGTEYRGKLDFVGTVRIDGQFEGEIATDGDLILGRKASITGTVNVGRLTSCGRIQGDVVVKERAVLEKTSVLNGTLNTPVLVVEKGAFVEGGIVMTTEKTASNPKVVTADFGGKTDQGPKDGVTVAKTGSDDSTV